VNPRSRVLLLGWRLAGRLPQGVVFAVMDVAATGAWLARGSGVRQLETNLRRVVPLAHEREIRRLSRENMRRYLRYYGETFMLGRVSPEQLLALVRPEGDQDVRDAIDEEHSALLALGHQGNYDLAGWWATAHIAPVTTVAERLEPPEVFEEFVALREHNGLTIIPLDDGRDVFRNLLRAVKGGGALVPLLADRDLTSRGIEVDMFGHRARVAAGPAALAVSTRTALFATMIRHERLHGAARRAAGSRWGIVLSFVRVPPVDPTLPRSQQVTALTQGWVDVLAADIRAHPADWHMLQKVFVADLDPERAARAAARTGAAPGA